jgi:signal peptidase I
MRPGDDLAAQLLRAGGRLRTRVRGGSMIPSLWDGDVALVSPTAGREVDVGDVVCFQTRHGLLCVHRVIKRDRERVVVKGDALAFVDVIEPGHVLGTVIAVQRRGGVKRLDTRIARWRNRVIVSVSTLLPSLIPLAVHVGRVVRGMRRG